MAIGEYRIGEKMSDEDSLAHYGVKGMKWGVRKKSGSGGSTLPLSVRMNPGARIGMKVGQAYVKRQTTPDSSGVTRRQAKQQIREQNKKLNRDLEDFERSGNRSDLIRSARANKVAANRKYEDIRDEIKAKKGSGEIGANAAKVIINQARNERYSVIEKAASKTTGEQFMEAMFGPTIRVI